MTQNEFSWRPLVISPNAAIRKSLLNVLVERCPERAVMNDYPAEAEILECVQAKHANVCFIDVSTDESRALLLIRTLASSEATIVALHIGSDSGLILRCLRCGAHEFISQPIEPGPAWAVLDQLAARRRGHGSDFWGSVYAVVPAKPNMGSTTVATNIAIRARNESSGSVLLADLDPLYGNVKFLLRIQASSTFSNAFSNWKRMDRELWDGCVVHHSGIDVLLAPEEQGLTGFEAPSPGEFVNFLRSRYAISFLDFPGLISEWYGQLASACDGVLLVTTNELAAVHAAKRSLASLTANSSDMAKLKILLNRYLPETGLACDAVETALRMPVFHTLPNDYAAVQKAVFEGTPVPSGSRLGQELDELCRRVIGTPAPRKQQRSWSSLFGFQKRAG